jgi:hypothetical protein
MWLENHSMCFNLLQFITQHIEFVVLLDGFSSSSRFILLRSDPFKIIDFWHPGDTPVGSILSLRLIQKKSVT